jgi:hypothetical protein
MAHRRFTHRRTPTAHALAAIMACGLPGLLHAQTAAPTPGVPAIAPYRLPAIALVQPQDGGAVYQDRPVIVLRFTAGEPSDPIDATSLAVNVDGVDRSKLFQSAGSDAWGPLAPSAPADSPLPLGAHRITARICSQRGACAMTQGTVLTIPNAATATSGPATARSIHQRILDAALNAARRIITP